MNSTCFVCKQQVKDGGIEFEDEGIIVIIHEGCLRLFGKITQKAFQSERIPQHPVRPTSIAEFIQEKQPKTQAEVLACVAYFLEQKEGKIKEFTTKELREELVTTRERIPDMGIALSNAVRRTPYIVRVGKRAGKHLYRLTKEGVSFVEKLPSRKPEQ